MFLRITEFQVIPERDSEFVSITLEHAANSSKEPAVERFEFYRGEAPHSYVIIVQFQDEPARAAHFQTDHFRAWRAAIEPMLSRPSSGAAWYPIEQ